MLRKLSNILFLAALVAAGSVGVVAYRSHFAIDTHVAELEQQKQQLQAIVQRLTGERRVAEVLVVGQHPATRPATAGPAPATRPAVETTFLFVERSRDGSTLPPKSFTIDGDEVHLDAMVVKFERDLVAKDDPLRGHSVALFTRVFGPRQSPENAFPIDPPGKIPDYYRGTDPAVGAFEQKLWADFWRLAGDADYRKQTGVRVAQGEGLWFRLEPQRVYTITLESDGGLNVVSEPVPGIYREAMKRNGAP